MAATPKNKDYCFNLSAKSDPPEWYIDAIVKSFSDDEFLIQHRPVNVLWYVGLTPIWDVFLDASFSISKTEKIENLWKVSFTLQSNHESSIFGAIRSGWVLLDSEACWAIAEYEVISESKPRQIQMTTKVKTKYEKNVDFVYPTPTLSVRTAQLPQHVETESFT